MKLFIVIYALLSLAAFAQTKHPPKQDQSHIGQNEHNCDEPCLKCGHKEACKDTKGNDTGRDVKPINNSNDEHKSHSHSSSEQ